MSRRFTTRCSGMCITWPAAASPRSPSRRSTSRYGICAARRRASRFGAWPAGPATVAGLVGSASLVAYLLAGTVVLGVGAALARLAARFESSGGPYLYVHRTFGPLAGFQVGWLFCLARFTAMANLLHAFALYLGALVPSLAQPYPQAALCRAARNAAAGVDTGSLAGKGLKGEAMAREIRQLRLEAITRIRKDF